MARIYVNLTEDHLKLIRNLNVQALTDETVGIAKDNLYGGTYKYEQMALILGLTDKAVPGTEEDMETGTLYEKEAQLYMMELDKYINENLLNIEEILHQFCLKGGLTVGKYVCKDYQHIWHRVEDES